MDAFTGSISQNVGWLFCHPLTVQRPEHSCIMPFMAQRFYRILQYKISQFCIPVQEELVRKSSRLIKQLDPMNRVHSFFA
jgi:hypothetical protein